MRIGALVQARMTSERCPGKMLRSLGHHVLLGQVLENLSRATTLSSGHATDPHSHIEDGRPHEEICVATSLDESDNAIEEYCLEHGWNCGRGDLQNVAERMLQVAEGNQWDAFVRISGDSPLIDFRIVDRLVEKFLESEMDLMTNVFPRSFPKGQSVEVIRVETLRSALAKFAQASDFEHVTPYFYRTAEDFRVGNLAHLNDMSSVQMSVDTDYDLEIAQSICQGISEPVSAYPWHVLLRLANEFHLQAMGVAI